MRYFENILEFKARLGRSVAYTLSAIAIALTLTFIATDSALAAPLAEAAAINQVLETSEATAADEAAPPSAAALFTSNCAGCHAHGGNVVRRGKNLKQKALKRYGYDDVTKISQIITHGKGIMSAYEDRLTGEEIGAIAQYVKTQSESGWK